MKKVIGIILIIAISLFVLTGCTSESVAETEERFIKVYKESNSNIYYDKETLVQYILFCNGYGAGLTVLVDADGKPLLYEGE